MTRERQARDARRRGVRVVLSDRDERVLRALARFRIARTGDLVRVAFTGIRTDTAARRLRRLFDAGYLAVRVGDQMAENVYSLGPKGRAWIGDNEGRAPRADLAHHLAVVETWSRLAGTVQGTPGIVLDLTRPDWEIRESLGSSSPLVPDLLVQLRVGDTDTVRLAIEVDCDTEPAQVLREKLAWYDELRSGGDGLFGWRDFVVAFALVGCGTSRRRMLERLLTSAGGGEFLLWTDADGLRSVIRALATRTAPPIAPSPAERGGLSS